MSVSFFSQSFRKTIRYVLLTVVLPIAFLSWGGILRTLDLAVYDLGFRLRPTEPMDERIVIVEWTEENLQASEETTISDDSFASLIKKIQAQQPRLIAFDIFRDIPVSSPNLTDEENNRAYNRLQNLFRTSPNLLGIEQVVAPKINPPRELKKLNQVGAVDLPSDRDGVIRRAYTFPQLTKEGKPSGIPYLAVALASKYLAEEGWESDMLQNNSLIFSNQQNSIIINPLKNFVGAYFDDRYGLDFLINWRKGNNLFRRVSATDVTSNQIPPDLFFDRSVIIGNVSSATGDRHTLPLNRWRRTDKIGTYGVETFGVEIVAQITSSIISAVLNGRALMNPVPRPIEMLLFLASVGGIILNIQQNRYRNNLYSVTLPYAVYITVILSVLCFIAHSMGWWLPIATIVAGVWVSYLSSIYYLIRRKERLRASNLEALVVNLDHNLGHKLKSFKSSSNVIKSDFEKIETILPKDNQDILEAKAAIYEAASNIGRETAKIKQYKMQIEHFLKYSYLDMVNSVTESIDVNLSIEAILNKFIAENKACSKVCILKKYDRRISSRFEMCGSIALEIILNNLLDNAIFAVSAKAKTADRYLPTVCVTTRLLGNRKIEVIIEDNGIGIPRAFQEKIFEAFESFKGDKQSTGLGLYLVKKIVTSHGGTIKVESVFEKGSKFIFTLPIVNRNHTRFFNNFLSFLRKK
jgi:CHASE2 domain-containing sensor protein/anti-sigma regulatory factor (Ser/Thr protein kinase)